MKKILLVLLLFAGMANAQTVTIPNSVFKAILLIADTNNTFAMDSSENPIKIDVNNDGQIQESEALAVYRLNLSNVPISDMTGISAFTNLKSLDCSNSQLTSLDLTALTNLTRLNCAGNQLTNLNITNLPVLNFVFCDQNELSNLNLTGLSGLVFLSCENNNLSTINLSGLTALKALLCSDNQIANLNVSVVPQLTTLQCNRNQLTSLDVSSLSGLTQLGCFYNQISTLNVSNLTSLTNLSCGENNITALNLDGLTNLISLECSYLPNNFVINGNGLTSLTNLQYRGQNSVVTFKGFPNLTSLNIFLNQPVVTVNVSGFSAQSTLYVGGGDMNGLTINGSGITNLGAISCSVNQLTSLSLNGLSNLSSLNCGNNKLTDLNLNNLPGLTWLDFGRNKLTTINLSSVPNLKHLDVNNNKLTTLDVSGLLSLEYLDCSNSSYISVVGNQITSLAITNLTNLKHLDFSNYGFSGVLGAMGNLISTINVNNLTNLQFLKCSKNNISNLVVNGLAQLTALDCSYNQLTSLDLIGLTNLTELNYSNNSLSNLNMTGLVNITELNCSNNAISTLTVNTMPGLRVLNCSGNLLQDLDLFGLYGLTELYCDNNQLSFLDVLSSPGLMFLHCNNNQLAFLPVFNMQLLSELQCSGNQISNLDVGNLSNLRMLFCSGNQLGSLMIPPNLNYLSCEFNQLFTLDLSNAASLEHLYCSWNQITGLNLSGLPLLQYLSCSNNQITSLNLSDLPNLGGLHCDNNQLTTLDAGVLPRLVSFSCDNNLLTELSLKNGSTEQLVSFGGNPSLAYICADGSDLQMIQNQLNTLGMTTTVSNSYCSFTPGGQHNTVIGTTIFDGNNNGCNQNDPLHPNIRVDFTNGVTTGSAFTNTNGICTFFAEAGNYTMFPNIENAAAFTISPASASVNFLNNNNNFSYQSFCLSANGFSLDVEIVISPITPARPGFDAVYEIVYKNKGNQVLSGNVAMTFDDSKMDLVMALPVVDNQTTGNLNWAYSGLLPFESRTIKIEFNVNTPLETPAVNNGDILAFTTSITPTSGDVTPLDNAFEFSQTVVNSFDPNDITCMQGEVVSPSEIGKYLHYIVNFENTGTASAVNVVVKIAIDETKYDLHSLQVLNTSHSSRSVITGNNAEFIFENIDLAEAAGNPPVGGHGNILFKIRTKESLVVGNEVKKTANIFFDYNAPIITNDAITTFATLSNPDLEKDKSIQLYPNPTNDIININCDSTIGQIELFDSNGRLLQTTIENKNNARLNIADKSEGIYFVRITTEKGRKVEKVIKQ